MPVKRPRTIDGTVIRVTPVITHCVKPGSFRTALCGQTAESGKAAIHILTSPGAFKRLRASGLCPDCLEWLHA